MFLPETELTKEQIEHMSEPLCTGRGNEILPNKYKWYIAHDGGKPFGVTRQSYMETLRDTPRERLTYSRHSDVTDSKIDEYRLLLSVVNLLEVAPVA